MDKYYTPKIEEFHVGFEFESKYVLFSRDLDWKTITLNDSHDWFWDSYRQDAVETEFRVKYLDKEDIESLGWKHYKTKDGAVFFEKGNNILLHNKDGISIIIKDPDKDINMRIKLRSHEVYMIDIKNKSELKRLLKQLGI